MMQKTFFITLLFLLATSCRSDIKFSSPGEDGGDVQSICEYEHRKGFCVESKTEVFTIGDSFNSSLDFLFVLDVSDSMTEDLNRLGSSFSDLMSKLEGQNKWKMFFTTADHGDHSYVVRGGKNIFSQEKWQNYKGSHPKFGQFMHLEHQGRVLSQNYLDADTPYYKAVFRDTLTRKSNEGCNLAPYCQGDLEQPLKVLKSSLEQAGKGLSPLLKESDNLINFIITDEDERVEDFTNATKASEVLALFQDIFPDKSMHSFGLLIKDEDVVCLRSQKRYSPQSRYATEISQLAGLTGGKNISLCETNYSFALREMSRHIKTLVDSLKLSHKPFSKEEVKVSFISGSEKNWILRGEKVIFENSLEIGDKIQVSYFVKR